MLPQTTRYSKVCRSSLQATYYIRKNHVGVVEILKITQFRRWHILRLPRMLAFPVTITIYDCKRAKSRMIWNFGLFTHYLLAQVTTILDGSQARGGMAHRPPRPLPESATGCSCVDNEMCFTCRGYSVTSHRSCSINIYLLLPCRRHRNVESMGISFHNITTLIFSIYYLYAVRVLT